MKSHKILFVVFFLIGVSAVSFSTALAVWNSPQESDRARKRAEWQRPAEVMDVLGVKSSHFERPIRTSDSVCLAVFLRRASITGPIN
jgi:hypothetical protein